MPKDLLHRAAFEQKGETVVRTMVSKGGGIGAEAAAWLAEQEAIRAAESLEKRDAREERTLAAAEEANAIAARALAISEKDLSAALDAASASREQARWAKWAAIAATMALIISNKDSILSALVWK
jgi:hypothetical protein